jgi:translation initiation factor 2 alpha subunit (eIF-2alpha)
MASNNELSNINTNTQSPSEPASSCDSSEDAPEIEPAIEPIQKHQYYSEDHPVKGELVLVEFTEECVGFFKANLLEYQYSGMLNFQDITKKRRVQTFRKFVPLKKNMVARVETVDTKAWIVQLSLAYLDEGNNSKEQSTTSSIQEKLMIYFLENKQMESFVKTFCILNKYNYVDVWTKFIHEIDRCRRVFNNEENEEDQEVSLFKYFNEHINDLEQWIEAAGLDESFSEQILELYKKKTVKQNQRILTKFGIISFGGVESTKQLLGRAFQDIKYEFSCRYETTPDYIFESSSADSCKEDHEKIVKFLQTEGPKQSPKIFIDVKFTGLNSAPVEAVSTV